MSGIIERVTPGQMEDPARLKMVQARLDMFADDLLKLLTWFPEVANVGRDLGFEVGGGESLRQSLLRKAKSDEQMQAAANVMQISNPKEVV